MTLFDSQDILHFLNVAEIEETDFSFYEKIGKVLFGADMTVDNVEYARVNLRKVDAHGEDGRGLKFYLKRPQDRGDIGHIHEREILGLHMHNLISDVKIGYVATLEVVAVEEIGKDISEVSLMSIIRRAFSNPVFNTAYALAYAQALSLGDRTNLGNFRLVDGRYINIDFEFTLLSDENIKLLAATTMPEKYFMACAGWNKAYREISKNYENDKALIDDFLLAADVWAKPHPYMVSPKKSLLSFLEMGELDEQFIDDYIFKKDV